MLKTLEGVKIIDFTLAGAGPFTGRMLQACGAESILVEPLQGTHTRVLPNFDYICSGKRSLTLNAKTPEGQEVLRRLIKEADVFLANYRTGALGRMHLSYEDVKAINPKIIYATITGFGDKGPAANHPGYDATAFFSRGSMLHTMSERDTLPNSPSTAGDFTAAVALCYGICAALYHREKTGEGMHVYNSLFQVAMAVNHDAISQAQRGGKFPKSRYTPYRALLNTYRCSDGKSVMITIPTLEKFTKFLTRVNRADELEKHGWKMLADVMGDGAPEAVKLLDEIFATMTRDEAIAVFNELDLACEPVQSVYDILEDEQAFANQYLQAVNTSKDDHPIIYPALPPVKFGEDATEEVAVGPRLGEHSVEILKSIGFDDSEIADMIEKGVTSDGSKADLYVVK